MSRKVITPQNVTDLLLTLLEIKSFDEIKSFLEDLLTNEELKEFANRWQVAKMLNEKIPYTQITEDTGVSSTTIARISKCLNRNNSGYTNLLSKLEN